MGVRFELDRYPLVIVRFPPTASIDEVHDWYDSVSRLLREAKTPLAFLDDLRPLEIGAMSASHRRTAAERHDELIQSYAHKHAGNARLVRGPVISAVLRVFDWLSPAPWPLRTFHEESEAIAWCEDLVGRDSGRAPPTHVAQ